MLPFPNPLPARRTGRRSRAAIFFVCVLFFGAVEASLTTQVASAHTSGGNATGGGQWHSWPSDGCTKAPNWVPGVYNFTHACQHHDGCYVNHWADRGTCDQWFLNDMRAGCAWWNTKCNEAAVAYYWAVRICGNYSYDNRSIWTPAGNLWGSCTG
jgi:hypothetical protein